MKNSTSPRRSESGFTLVELLLAITLMAILLGLAYGGLRAATRVTVNGQVLLAEAGKVRIAHQFIRRQLNQMQPLTFEISDDSNQTPVVFEGSSRRIRFVAPMPGYLGQGGPQVQYLELVNGADGLDLLFSHQLLLGYDPAYTIEREPIVLLEGIEQAWFEFLGKDEEGQLTAWSNSWDSPDVLPVAVGLSVELGEESRSTWPLLIAGVKVDEMASSLSGAERSYSDAIRAMISRPAEPVQ